MYTILIKLIIAGMFFSLCEHITISTWRPSTSSYMISCYRMPRDVRVRLWELSGSIYVLTHLCLAYHESSTLEYLRRFQTAWILYQNIYKYFSLSHKMSLSGFLLSLMKAAYFHIFTSSLVTLPMLLSTNLLNIYQLS